MPSRHQGVIGRSASATVPNSLLVRNRTSGRWGVRDPLTAVTSRESEDHEVEPMERTMLHYFQRSVERFPNKDFQRIKESGRFKGVTYHQAHETVL